MVSNDIVRPRTYMSLTTDEILASSASIAARDYRITPVASMSYPKSHSPRHSESLHNTESHSAATSGINAR